MEINLNRSGFRLRLISALIAALMALSSCASLSPRTQYTTTYHRGCSALKVWQACPTVTPTGLAGTLHPDTPAFNAVHITGPYNVQLRADRGSHNVVIHGDASVIGRTHVYVKDGTLRIKAEEGFAYGNNNRANVDIRMGGLSRIYFDSPGSMNAEGIRATRLMVIANHRARIKLKGNVRNLDVVTYEQAKINAQELKVKKTLSAAATGDSRLFHNQQPAYRNAYPKPRGAIVRMGGLRLEPKCDKPPCQVEMSDWQPDPFADE